MSQPPTNICPLLAIAAIGTSRGPSVCIKECCALWDFGENECVLHSIADAIRERAESNEK